MLQIILILLFKIMYQIFDTTFYETMYKNSLMSLRNIFFANSYSILTDLEQHLFDHHKAMKWRCTTLFNDSFLFLCNVKDSICLFCSVCNIFTF
jgi:hypothetical protein